MKMKRFLAIFAIIAVLCTFCTAVAFADEGAEITDVIEVALDGDTTPPPAPPAGPVEGPASSTKLTLAELQALMAGDGKIAIEVNPGAGKLEEHNITLTPDNILKQVDPTCTEEGYLYVLCDEADCQAENLWHQVTIKALGHDWTTDYIPNDPSWGEATDVPTCQQSGTAVEVCLRCGAHGEERELNAIPHAFTTKVVDVDNCKEYKYHYECSYGCGTVETYEEGAKKGQTIYYGLKDGYVDDEGVVTAGEEVEGVFAPVKETKDNGYILHHDWTDWSVDKEATCAEDGSMSRACVICGAKQEETIYATGEHQWKVIKQWLKDCNTVEVTYKCDVCKAEDEKEIKGNFHKFEIVNVTEKPTCTKNGEANVACKYCGKTDTEVLPALGHDFGEWKLEKTFMKDGEEVGFYTRTCERCAAHEELISAESPITEPVTPPVEEPDENTYAISTIDVNKDAAGISGTGQLLIVDGDQPIGELYARTAFLFENEAGEQLLVVNAVTVKEDGSFLVPSVKAPFGYTLKTAHIVAINDEAGMYGAWAPYAVCDPVIL